MSVIVRTVERGLRGRGWFARLLLGLTALALLLPSLSAVEPDLAGWSPTHGHIYASGAPVDHAHPWDRDGAQAEDVTFTWDNVSTVFAVTVPMAVALVVTSTLLVALERVRPLAPPSVFATIPTPPPR